MLTTWHGQVFGVGWLARVTLFYSGVPLRDKLELAFFSLFLIFLYRVSIFDIAAIQGTIGVSRATRSEAPLGRLAH